MYNVIPGFCSIYFTLTLPELKNIVCHKRDFVIKGFVMSGLHCFHRNVVPLLQK